MKVTSNLKLAIVGLGYVGLPLAIEFGKKFRTIGFDINQVRIEELEKGKDATLEVSHAEIVETTGLSFTNDFQAIADCTVYIVTVPTPIDENNFPNLSPLEKASKSIGHLLKQGDVVIYESTVYPGATEEICIPILEQVSGLTFNKGFSVGYSPERINPGDKKHRVTDILKVTSGSTPGTADFVNKLYQTIITAGTHMASSIKVAEAAKVIENTQRDINIALVNELAVIFNMLDIDTEEVLKAAETKWNFMPIRPGLVGGHCIGVDPYYLTYKAQSLGYEPNMILAGRRQNDGMSRYVVDQLVKQMAKQSIQSNGAKVLVMGLAFKENCPDLRNTKIVDIVNELKTHNMEVNVYDPWVNPSEAEKEYGIVLLEKLGADYDGIILAVAHDQFKQLSIEEIRSYGKENHIIYDLKYIYKANDTDLRL